jgi:hypothetical protein
MLIALRIAIVLVVLSIGVALILYVITRERRYLSIAWTIFWSTVLLLLALAAMMVFERLVLRPNEPG